MNRSAEENFTKLEESNALEVGALGIEPRTNGLKVRCSTAELRAHLRCAIGR